MPVFVRSLLALLSICTRFTCFTVTTGDERHAFAEIRLGVARLLAQYLVAHRHCLHTHTHTHTHKTHTRMHASVISFEIVVV